jgi:hypothetical protein
MCQRFDKGGFQHDRATFQVHGLPQSVGIYTISLGANTSPIFGKTRHVFFYGHHREHLFILRYRLKTYLSFLWTCRNIKIEIHILCFFKVYVSIIFKIPVFPHGVGNPDWQRAHFRMNKAQILSPPAFQQW